MEIFKKHVSQELFDYASDLLSYCSDAELPFPEAFDREPLKRELALLLWNLQNEAEEPLRRSTNLYGKDEWITPEDIAKV